MITQAWGKGRLLVMFYVPFYTYNRVMKRKAMWVDGGKPQEQRKRVKKKKKNNGIYDMTATAQNYVFIFTKKKFKYKS